MTLKGLFSCTIPLFTCKGRGKPQALSSMTYLQVENTTLIPKYEAEI